MGMPATIRLPVSEEEQARLARYYDETDQAETRTRAQMVLLAAAGRTAPQIAPLVRRSVDTVQRVLRRYQREGLAGIPQRPRSGRPVAVPAAWQAELRRVIDLDPRRVGVPSATWTTQRLAAYLARTTGHRTGIETVRRQLHQAGYVCKRPTWTLRRKAAAQPEWAKNASGWRPSWRPRPCRRLHPHRSHPDAG
jgi:transposase